MRARLADVAELAGVSTSTASLVLSGKGARRISASTSARVRQAAAQLRYTRRAPQSTALGVGLMLDTQGTADVAIEAVEAAQSEAWDQGHGPVLAARLGADSDVDHVAETLVRRGAAGLIYFTQWNGPVQPVTSPPVPTVYTNCRPSGDSPHRRYAVVSADERSIAREAALAVLQRGHRKALLVAGSADDDTVGLWSEVAAGVWTEAGMLERPEVCRISRPPDPRLNQWVDGPSALIPLDAVALGVVRSALWRRQNDLPSGGLVVMRGLVGERRVTPRSPVTCVTFGAAVSDLLRVAMRTLLDGGWREGGGAPTEPREVVVSVRAGMSACLDSPPDG